MVSRKLVLNIAETERGILEDPFSRGVSIHQNEGENDFIFNISQLANAGSALLISSVNFTNGWIWFSN